MAKKRVTLLDVAKHAGVSRATASLIVRGKTTIKDSTKEKVLHSINELGYVYDRVAANMRSQTSSTIGLIITDIANPYYSELLVGVHNALDEAGFNVFLGTTFDSDKKQESLLSTMLEHRVGGVILCPVSDSSHGTIERMRNMDIPLVHAVREIPSLNVDYIGIDYKLGANIAVKHLIDNGHRRIAFIGGTSESSAWQLRKEGYSTALTDSGIEFDQSLVIESLLSREGGRSVVKKALQVSNPPTAIFCFNDLVAFGVMQGLRDEGLTPGEDISVVGFDNVKEATLSNPPLTTIESFPRTIGSHAAEVLLQRIGNPNTSLQQNILQPNLIKRST